MVARSSAPVIGAVAEAGFGNSNEGRFSKPGKWEFTVNYRLTPAHNHFTGTQSAPPAVQAISSYNTTHLFSFLLTHNFTPRWSLSANVPLLIGDRTVPGGAFGPGAPDQVTHSRGIGDVIVSAQAWLWRPPTESGGNIALSFGLKLPTGKADGMGTVNTLNGPKVVPLDQSIQLGDGTWGFTLGTQAYKRVKGAVLFFQGSYLFAPADTNGVNSGRSVASGLGTVYTAHDMYLAEAGAAHGVPKVRGLTAVLGIRTEGVPAKDLIGKSDGFREPGYAISLDPGLEYSHRRSTWTISAPLPLQRDRERSVPEIQSGKRAGSAFADYVILTSYTVRF